jgi:molybdopterin molybdotransferase
MVSVIEAEKLILECSLPVSTEGVVLPEANGRVLCEDLRADRNFPPFNRVTMDGIAIRFEDFKNGQRQFAIKGVQAAGMPQIEQGRGEVDTCFEVMTGAIVPLGYDSIIRYEDLKIENGIANVLIENIDYQQNIHFEGTDRKAGDALKLRGSIISAAEIATAATIGKTSLQVAKLPKVAIISTGDELKDVHETPLPHQIRRSNVYAIAAILESHFKLKSAIFHFNDDKKEIYDGLSSILSEFDFVPTVLNELGVEKLFHKVSQRPGKPFWFGKWQSEAKQAVIFAFPGNPVSTFMCSCRYLVPFLHKSLGISLAPQYALLAEDFIFKPNLTYFLQVKLVNDDGVLKAIPLEGGGSGDLANLNDADGFLELPLERVEFKKGEIFPLIRYR